MCEKFFFKLKIFAKIVSVIPLFYKKMLDIEKIVYYLTFFKNYFYIFF